MKIANLNKHIFTIPNVMTIPSGRNIYGQCGFKQGIINSLKDKQELMCSIENYEQTPNIQRIIQSLRSGNGKYKWQKTDLLELFQIYLDNEQLEDDGIDDEFGDDSSFNECFFIEWLRDEDDERPGMCIKDEDLLLRIWNYLHDTHVGNC